MKESRPKVLYVDDEATNLLFFKISFQYHLDVITAASGIEALKILEEGQAIDIIISDMMMPEMDGLEFLENAKKIDAHIPRFMISGYNQSEEISEAIKSGLITTYLTKPLEKDQLMHAISKLNK